MSEEAQVLKLFGIPGLFLGPIGLILIEDLVKMLYTENNNMLHSER